MTDGSVTVWESVVVSRSARRSPQRKDEPRTAPGASKRRRASPALTDEDRGARIQTLLDAALDVFLERGYDAAKLDEIAARAGVAKGTLYLYFASKEKLFEALIQSVIASPIEALGRDMLSRDIPAEMMLRGMIAWAKTEVLGTRRREIARLIISEAGRFPDLAAFYHREVISKAMANIRLIMQRGIERGEFTTDAVARFPQLAVAPLLVGIIWSGLFDPVEKLDASGLLDAHADLLIRGLKGQTP